jgi:hypothetical protein
MRQNPPPILAMLSALFFVAAAPADTNSLIEQQVARCWNAPFGSKVVKDLSVQIDLDINMGGTVFATDIVDKYRYGSDLYFHSMADSVVRAARNPGCSPLKLPADQYDQWKHVRLTFDPRTLL